MPLIGVSLMDAGRDGDIEVDRFYLHRSCPRRILHIPVVPGAWGTALATRGVELSRRAAEAMPSIAAKYGIPVDPEKDNYTIADGPAFLVALLALYDGKHGGGAAPIEGVA